MSSAPVSVVQEVRGRRVHSLSPTAALIATTGRRHFGRGHVWAGPALRGHHRHIEVGVRVAGEPAAASSEPASEPATGPSRAAASADVAEVRGQEVSRRAY